MKNNLLVTLLLICTLLFPSTILSQAEAIFNKVSFGDSVDVVQEKISIISEELIKYTNENPSFPLAKNQEDHLVCTNVTTKYGNIGKIVFTFSDNALSYIEATGNAATVLAKDRSEEAREYMHFHAYFDDLVIIDKANDRTWILTKESVHPNLFAWENPYLKGNTSQKYNPSGKIPDFLQMGASIEKLEPLLKSNSKFMGKMELDGSDPNAQLQLDCFGIEYAGFPRKMEARFGDGKLNVVWILTAKGEEDRVRKELVKHYGNPIFANEDWEIFNDWQVGLRKDKPEVLLMTKEVGYGYKKDYFKQ
jgi:hypothetical protein